MSDLPHLSSSADDQIAAANASDLTPVVFIHGLWLLPSSWDRWAAVFADRFAFANLVTEEEAHELYATFAVPASGEPLFQAAAANLNPWTEAKADFHNPQRGPLLVIEGIGDNTSPPAINEAAFKLQQRNPGVTEIASIQNRGHSLTIDSGWREVCDTALSFIQRFA